MYRKINKKLAMELWSMGERVIFARKDSNPVYDTRNSFAYLSRTDTMKDFSEVGNCIRLIHGYKRLDYWITNEIQ